MRVLIGEPVWGRACCYGRIPPGPGEPGWERTMTESAWLVCGSPQLMLDHLRDSSSPRQLRHFACACLRAVWHLLSEPSSRAAVEVAERFAEGQASASELVEAGIAAF